MIATAAVLAVNASGQCVTRKVLLVFTLIPTDTDFELVGFTTCNGCLGGNVEYAGEEMVKNGAEIIHLATGMVVG